jgi:vacuolar-type H+-ATPase subunit H
MNQRQPDPMPRGGARGMVNQPLERPQDVIPAPARGGTPTKKEQVDTLLARMEEQLTDAKGVPFSDRCMVSRDDMLFMLRMVRESLPEELAEAKWLLEQNRQLIAEARKEAEKIMRDAEAQTARMIDEHEVTQQAQAEAREMLEQAVAQATEIRENAINYTKGILTDLENELTEMLVYIQKNKKDLP